MAKTLSIAGVSYPDVPAVDFNLTSGGITRFYDCVGSTDISENGEYDVVGLASINVNVSGGDGTPKLWCGGDNPELVAEINNFYSLADNGFTASGVSTSAKTLMSSVTLSAITLPSIRTEDYVAITETKYIHDYTSVPSNTAYTYGAAITNAYSFVSRYNGTVSSSPYNQYIAILPNHTYNRYFSNKGVEYWAAATTYGIGGAVTAPTLSSTSAEKPTVSFKTPTLTVRTNNTYMASGAWNNISPTTSGLRYHVRLYRVDFGTSLSGQAYANNRAIVLDDNWGT